MDRIINSCYHLMADERWTSVDLPPELREYIPGRSVSFGYGGTGMFHVQRDFGVFSTHFRFLQRSVCHRRLHLQ